MTLFPLANGKELVEI